MFFITRNKINIFIIDVWQIYGKITYYLPYWVEIYLLFCLYLLPDWMRKSNICFNAYYQFPYQMKGWDTLRLGNLLIGYDDINDRPEEFMFFKINLNQEE